MTEADKDKQDATAAAAPSTAVATHDDVAVVETVDLRKVFISFAAEDKVLRSLSKLKLLGIERVMMQAYGLIAPRRRVEAVRGLNVRIEKGQLYGLLGPNGSGKSTTVKMLLGLIAPSGGTARVFGKPPEHIQVKQRIGFLPEETYLYRFLNAEETLDFYGQLFNIPRKLRKERADRLIEMVGLGHARKRRLAEYSKGMARRLGLAQALINDPEFIILDEPTTGLDPIGVAEMKAMLLELKGEGKTILMCSHLLADVEEICDRCAIMCDGDLLVEGPISELLAYTDLVDVRIDRADAAFEKRLREFIEREGAHVLSVSNPSDSLSRLFLKLVDEKRPGTIDPALKRQMGLIDEPAPNVTPGPAHATPAEAQAGDAAAETLPPPATTTAADKAVSNGASTKDAAPAPSELPPPSKPGDGNGTDPTAKKKKRKKKKAATKPAQTDS